MIRTALLFGLFVSSITAQDVDDTEEIDLNPFEDEPILEPEPPKYYRSVPPKDDGFDPFIAEEEEFEIINGHAGGEHAAHALDGEDHDDCGDCLAESNEVTHTQEMMFVFIGLSLSLLMVWLMMRRCKQTGADEEESRPRKAVYK